MLIPVVLLIFFAAMFLLFRAMTKVFNTRPVDYTATPADLKLLFEVVRFPTQNGLSLHGWWIPSSEGEGKPVVILLHGWRRNAERMMPYIEALHGDVNLFVFDSRNHGKSDSDTYSSMPRFAEDIRAAVDYLEEATWEKYSGAIGLVGLSMGGAASIYAAAADERIRAVITVGAFANPAEVMRLEYKKRHIPYFPMVWLVFEYFQYHMKARFNDFAPEKHIGRAGARFLVVHGTEDHTAPFSHGERLTSAAAPGRAKLLSLEGAGHSNCHEFDGFWPAVRGFLMRVLTS